MGNYNTTAGTPQENLNLLVVPVHYSSLCQSSEIFKGARASGEILPYPVLYDATTAPEKINGKNYFHIPDLHRELCGGGV